MAQANLTSTTSRFHNLCDQALADALGYADSVLKGAEAECKSLKDEFKRRGLTEVAGDTFTVTATSRSPGGSIARPSRSSWASSYRRFEVAVVSTVIRIKAAQKLAQAA